MSIMARSNWFCFCLLLAFVVVVAPCSCYLFDFIPHKHRLTPWITYSDVPGEIERVELEPTGAPWIAVQEDRLTSALANTNGFRITSAIIEQKSLISFMNVDLLHQELPGRKFFIPFCDGVTIYVRKLANESEILEKNPGIIDDLRSGRKYVEKQLVKKTENFYGGGNVSVSHPYVYSDESVVVHGADGFGSLEFEETAGHTMKIEMVVVANIVPYQADCNEYLDLYGLHAMLDVELQGMIAECKRKQMPIGITMLYSLHY